MDLTTCCERTTPERALLSAGRFRFGQRIASVCADDPAFRERFLRLYFDCLEPSPHDSDFPAVRLEVSGGPSDEAVCLEMSEHDYDFDPGVVELLIPGFTLTAADRRPGGWRAYARPDDRSNPVLAASGGRILIDTQMPWRIIAGHYFVHHLMRLQPEMFFFHGASVVIGGRGIFLGGTKASGKSTLALALAARGHGFLGDEIAAIHASTGVTLPFPRAVSIREGPQSDRVHAWLKQRAPERETLADGTARVRVRVSEIFPGALAPPAPLVCALFLCGFAGRPEAEIFEFSTSDLPRLGPLIATFGSHLTGSSALALLKLFASVRCYKIRAGGTPQQTADLIERIVEDQWATASSKELNASGHFAG